jgi:hypothetical protein
VEQSSSVKPFYFFHIPKTAGRFFYANVVRLIEHDFIASGKQYTDIVNGYGHASFKPLDGNNVLSFTVLRDPIARTISHYQHIYRNYLTGDIQEYKKEFLDFMFNNPTKEIVDYQTKFISYDGDDKIIDIDGLCLKETLDKSDVALAKERLSKVDYLFKMDDINHETAKKSLELIRKHFNLEPKSEYLESTLYNIINPKSKLFRESLTAKEISMLESLMHNDYEIYNNSKYTDVELFLK